MSEWFSPIPHEYNKTRITLDFGLSAVTRRYNEVIVPKIGAVWRLRAISFALAGIKLGKELGLTGKKPSDIAHAIEALANKIEWEKNKNVDELGIRGINGFKKYPEEWHCEKILTYYVKSNTMRQSTVSALKSFGLVTGGTFNSFVLEPMGELVAESFLTSNVGVRDALVRWIKGISNDRSKLQLITADKIFENEKEIKTLLGILKSVDPCGNARRKNIWELFEKKKSYKDLNDEQQKKDIEMVEAFEALKMELVNFYLATASHIGKDISKINISREALDDAVTKYEAKQKLSGVTHANIENLLNKIKSNKILELIKVLVQMEPDLILIDSSTNKVQEGLLYDKVRINELKKEKNESGLQKLNQIKSLVNESGNYA